MLVIVFKETLFMDYESFALRSVQYTIYIYNSQHTLEMVKEVWYLDLGSFCNVAEESDIIHSSWTMLLLSAVKITQNTTVARDHANCRKEQKNKHLIRFYGI